MHQQNTIILILNSDIEKNTRRHLVVVVIVSLTHHYIDIDYYSARIFFFVFEPPSSKYYSIFHTHTKPNIIIHSLILETNTERNKKKRQFSCMLPSPIVVDLFKKKKFWQYTIVADTTSFF